MGVADHMRIGDTIIDLDGVDHIVRQVGPITIVAQRQETPTRPVIFRAQDLELLSHDEGLWTVKEPVK